MFTFKNLINYYGPNVMNISESKSFVISLMYWMYALINIDKTKRPVLENFKSI